MRSRVEYIVDQPNGRGPAGGVKTVPAVLWEAFAELRPLSMRETLEGGGVESEVTHRLAIRHRDGVTSEGRFRLKGASRTFEIASVLNVEERNRELVCLVIEKGG
ncbi:phage head closure protein [Paludisphaera sp.]|uniref:phage head closure protein n=1 Tax=Paludisphaera sp. TaxID=2017432 RepID=UPI00301CEDA0